MAEDTKEASLSMKGVFPIGYKRSMDYPCPEESFGDTADIISGLRDLPEEYLVIELQGYPSQMEFIQAARNGDKYLIELGLNVGKEKPQIFRLPEEDRDECIEIFRR